jgi:hypothetical protein
MSEYQYFEFVAIDRRLTETEMADLRALSTRARISATSFVNTYHWGDFRGDPRVMVERYFDAYLHLTNWGTRHLMLRFPADLLDEDSAAPYCGTDTAQVWTRDGHTMLSWVCDDDSGQDWDEQDGEGLLASIVPARADLAAGDRRLLYLGWLVAAQSGDLDDDEISPPVPAGLDDMSGSVQAAAEFLRIDTDLVAAAAEFSPPAPARTVDADLAAWVGRLPAGEKDALVLSVLRGEQAQVAARLHRRFRAETGRDLIGDDRALPTVGELLDVAARRALERRRKAGAARVAESARREQARTEAARRRRVALAAEGEKAWSRVYRLIEGRQPTEYDAAVVILTNLQMISKEQGGVAEFDRRLASLRLGHVRKPILQERLDAAGLIPGIPATP